MKFFWIFAIIGAIVGGVTLMEAFTADSAPKQAAAAAMAAALAIIPYCFARALNELGNNAAEELKMLNEKAATHTRLLTALANASEPAKPEPAN